MPLSPSQQDSGLAGGGLARGLEQTAHRRAARFEQRPLFNRLAQHAVFGTQAADLQRAVDDVLDLLEREGLGQVIAGAGLHRLDGVFNRRVGGHQDDGASGVWRRICSSNSTPFISAMR